MKFKHLLILAFFSAFVVSCSRNTGDNFSFTAPVADTTGTASAATPVSAVTMDPADVPKFPISGENSNNFFGNPTPAGIDTAANRDDYLINQGYYVESYSASRQTPNWVCWHIDPTTLGPQGRTDAFAAFGGLPATYFAVQSDSYDATDFGFDRGHNCPSADRSSTLLANKATFLMTNMIPQAPQNNQGTWGNLEDYIRTQVTAGNEVYIAMGCYGSGGTGSKGTFSAIQFTPTVIATMTAANVTKFTKYFAREKINVPSNIWKVVIILPVGTNDISRVTASTKIIAVNTPNINTINSDWTKYITTVSSIEALSNASAGATAGQKINLFGAITDLTLKAALKAKIGDGK